MIVGCQEGLTRQWNTQGEPLGQLLNEMTAIDKSYRWEVQDGAINLLPTAGEPLLLQTHVGKFKIDTTSSLEALNQLKTRPEIQQAMLGLRLQDGLTIIMYSPRETPFQFGSKGEHYVRRLTPSLSHMEGTSGTTARSVVGNGTK